jgi:hypothetical protein
MGVRKPPRMPRIATTCASSRTAITKAAAVTRVISRNVGTGPKKEK